MRVALVFGVQGEKVKPKLANVRDNLRLDCYKNVTLFIDNSVKRELKYDRVVILGKGLTKSELNDLHTYWSNVCRDTILVFICKKGDETEKAKVILNTFVSINVACMLLESTTVKELTKSIIAKPESLLREAGLDGFLNLDDSQDEEFSFEEPVEEPKEEQSNTTTGGSKTTESSTKKKKKKSILGALFGKKETVSEPDVPVGKPNVPVENIEEPNIPVENVEKSDTPMGVARNPQSDEETTDTVGVDAQYVDQSSQTEDFEFDMNDEVADAGMTSFSSDSEEIDEVADNSEVDIDMEDLEDFTETIDDGEYDNEYSDEDFESETENSNIDDSESVATENLEDDFADFSDFEEVEVDDTDTKPKSEETFTKKFSEEAEVVEDDDFSDIDFSQPDNKVSAGKSHIEVTEVDDDMTGGINLADVEANYQGSKQKVITKIVEKEVIRTVGGSSIAHNIVNGSAHRTVIFTGDRGTGITAAAFTLAKEFAKKIPVLYLDLDVERHGLLSYIDYQTFINYEEQQLEGVKRCQSSKMFDNCVCRYDVNFDILTTDYSCDTSDEAIEICQSVVAEHEMDYGVIVVDCPFDKLPLLIDLLTSSSIAICVEGSKRGIMNMLCSLEASPLSTRYKRMVVNKGSMLMTKLKKGVSTKDIVDYARTIYESDGCDYLAMPVSAFGGKYTKDLLAQILEV